MAVTPKPVELKNGQIKWKVSFRLNGKVTAERFTSPEAAYDFIHMGEKHGWDVAVRLS